MSTLRAAARPTALPRGLGAREGRPRPVLLRAVAPQRWDSLLRTAGLIGLAAIALTLFAPWPGAADLAALFTLSVLINGPHSPLTPVGFEPVLMAYGTLFPPLLVATVGLAAQLMVEYVNYHLYEAVLHAELLRRARESRVTQRVLRWYGAAPFATTAIVALTPLPYWTLRITAPLAHYPVSRHLAATAVGRFPRLWLYAALGTLLPVSGGAILAAGLGITAVFVIATLARQRLAAARA